MRVAVCPVEELPPGELRAVDVDRRSICVINSGGRYYAVRNRCPHQGSSLAKGTVAGTMLPSAPHQLVYGMEGKVLRCGWHAWEFDLETGNSLFDPEGQRVKTYSAGASDGMVWVDA
ncbi:MAG: Rieske (2Fe-2S) protein [Candidatus Dormibacteraeota bacterium]|nr:Rieske (2Fe-2S) protein [Candidatus Dormibacteraeota bacterium]